MFRELAEEADIAISYASNPLTIEDRERARERHEISVKRHGLVVASSNVSSDRLAVCPAESVTRRAVTWDDIVVEVIQSMTHDKLELAFRGLCDLLLMYQEGGREGCETSVDEPCTSSRRNLSRTLSFVPAGQEFRESRQPRSFCRIICFYLNPTILRMDADRRDQKLQPRLSFEDEVVWETAVKLARLVENYLRDLRYCEALSIVVVRELQRNATQHIEPARGGLALWQQRLVTSHIEEHLAEKVTLTALATLVRLSTSHFCRAFNQSFGIPPHRYLLRSRVERAKTLLQIPELSVTAVGLAVGFSDTSAFSSKFRQFTGRTPTQYRRSLGTLRRAVLT